ncbi:hypothetical protein M0R45_017186 [Rubus argutus]|uniref:Uncharacterized protein n=1 Tax=Rubus argutus TaxID=59490 RepID=A0AAW1XXA2_RUBAR
MTGQKEEESTGSRRAAVVMAMVNCSSCWFGVCTVIERREREPRLARIDCRQMKRDSSTSSVNGRRRSMGTPIWAHGGCN